MVIATAQPTGLGTRTSRPAPAVTGCPTCEKLLGVYASIADDHVQLLVEQGRAMQRGDWNAIASVDSKLAFVMNLRASARLVLRNHLGRHHSGDGTVRFDEPPAAA